MRRLLTPDLRRHFETAWSIVPWIYADRLKAYIETVRCFPSLRGAVVKRKNAPPLVLEEDALALFAVDDNDCHPIIALTIGLGMEPEGEAVLAILHELAHAAFHMEQAWRGREYENAPQEVAAWLQAASWMACSGRPDAKLLTDRAVQYARVEGLHFHGATLGEMAAWRPFEGNK